MGRAHDTDTDRQPMSRRLLDSLNAGSLAVAVSFGFAAALLFSPFFITPFVVLLGRSLFLAMVLLLVFATVQALVEGQSPRAADMLRSLIAYLRAAMPRLHDGEPTLGNELALVCANGCRPPRCRWPAPRPRSTKPRWRRCSIAWPSVCASPRRRRSTCSGSGPLWATACA